ncbi:MAG: UDP-N-acetylglucosamine 1-carboxyvinyltransferase, partial [Hyphomicrobiaceae bacterium]|nr:UDP-N-acetylglucosamine 1-carboxyvinyltransferase [Hyphomicrobiaceae bacterium]
MDRIKITGGGPLKGTIAISGAKNAALPLMIASLLTSDTLTLKNVPNLADVLQLGRILRNHGTDFTIAGKRPGKSQMQGETFHLTSRDIWDTTAPYEMVSKMRASFWVLGPLLGREHKARVSLPGGCAIGTRPVDLHLEGLKKLGANIDLEDGYVIAKAPKGGLRGGRIKFPLISVGATHNCLLACVLARGETVIENAAAEPEIGDVARCLVKMGAKIEGIDSHTLRIQGVDQLEGAVHTVLPDRIEAGTYAMLVAATGGDVFLQGADPETLHAALDLMTESGVKIKIKKDGIQVTRGPRTKLKPVHVDTEPFPGFPTDLQAQMMALLCTADGVSVLEEKIFENRFMHAPELMRMGARIEVHGGTATVTGVERLKGAPVMATDLRASVSLILAGVAAAG